MSHHAILWLWAGLIISLTICWVAYAQKRDWRRPPRTPAEAQRRATWSALLPYSQLGVHVRPDGFVYANGTGKCLGQFAAATAATAKIVPVTCVKPQTGWATITFADGTEHRHWFGLRNQAIATAQVEKFNGLAKQTAQGAFRRSCTRPQPAPRP